MSYPSRLLLLISIFALSTACSGDTQVGPGKCSESLPCQSGSICLQGNCAKLCSASAACSPAMQCLETEGICAAGAGECTSNEECTNSPGPCHRAPGICEGGACTYPTRDAGESCASGRPQGVCASQNGICDDAGQCIYTVRAGGSCVPPPSAGPCAATAGVCSAVGECVYSIEEGKACSSNGYRGPCVTNAGTCNAAGQCQYILHPAGTPCENDNLCATNYACDDQGRCVGEPTVCDDPDAPRCLSDDTFLTYKLPGKCNPTDGQCYYEPTQAFDCFQAGSCTGSLPPCLLDICGNRNVFCPGSVCSTSGRCGDYSYCVYQPEPLYSACDSDGVGGNDGLCAGPNDCDSNICRPSGSALPVSAGDRNPNNNCQICDPGRTRTAWSRFADGTGCSADGVAGICRSGTCETTRCYIEGAFYDAGSLRPGFECMTCQPAVAPGQWSTLGGFADCNTQVGICISGRCENRCFIEGAAFDAGAVNPSNQCQVCDPLLATHVWTARPESGMACVEWNGTQGVCDVGECVTNCHIDGGVYQDGEADPNGCRHCDTSNAIYSWTHSANDIPCTGGFCNQGACVSGCNILGQVYPAGSIKDAANDACQWCAPVLTETAWSGRGDYGWCNGGGGLCKAGSCDASICSIDGIEYASGTDPGNSCRSCDPTLARTRWQHEADGTACGATGEYCFAGSCTANVCNIDGTLHNDNAPNPDNSCKSCSASNATTWSDSADGTSCGHGCSCTGGAATESTCSDGRDNDDDGLFDCADVDCSGVACDVLEGGIYASSIVDTYIRENRATSNYNTASTLELNSTVNAEYQSWVQFDSSHFSVSDFTAGVGLKFYVPTVGSCPEPKMTLNLHTPRAAWGTDITWNNRPPIDGVVVEAILDYKIGWVTIDVTQLALFWANFPDDNFGLVLRNTDPGCPVTLRSSNFSSTYSPKLIELKPAASRICNYATGECQ